MGDQGEDPLGRLNKISEEMIAENDFRADRGLPTIYTVDKRNKTVKGVVGKERPYEGTEHQTFFDELPVASGIVQNGDVFLVKETLRNSFHEILEELERRFGQLKAPAGTGAGSDGGSRRRRPSRKYKKSKRVLRRKSRSTRRR